MGEINKLRCAKRYYSGNVMWSLMAEPYYENLVHTLNLLELWSISSVVNDYRNGFSFVVWFSYWQSFKRFVGMEVLRLKLKWCVTMTVRKSILIHVLPHSSDLGQCTDYINVSFSFNFKFVSRNVIGLAGPMRYHNTLNSSDSNQNIAWDKGPIR